MHYIRETKNKDIRFLVGTNVTDKTTEQGL